MALIDYDTALEHCRQAPQPLPTESCTLGQATGRILAVSPVMPTPQPPFDRTTMDGFALVPHGTSPGDAPYAIKGSLAAGDDATWTLAPGEAIRIMTGARAPQNTTVVPIEQCEVSADESTVTVPAAAAVPGKNIAWQGEDANTGAPIGVPGQFIDSAGIAALAMTHATEVTVYQQPTVTILTTGDEVDGTGETSIANTNGPLLASLCQGYQLPVQARHITDQLAPLTAALQQATTHIIVTTGGVSAGDYDYVPSASVEAGFEPIFHGIAMQPGKPVYFAKHPDGRIHLGLPGNPVSVLATSRLFLPALLSAYWPGFAVPAFQLPLTKDQKGKRRRLFLPARLVDGGVEPIAWHGSGDLFAASAADGLIDLAPNTIHEAGSRVAFHPYLNHQFGSRIQMERFGDLA